MSKILSRILNIFKYLLLVIAFGLIFYGVLKTYKRLEKPLTEAIPLLIPFVLLFVIYLVNLFIKKNPIKDNLLYNFVSTAVMLAIIIIGVRAMFDVNMLYYEKYKINYNPAYLSDNLGTVKIMLYCLCGANVLLLIFGKLDKTEKIVQQPILQEEKPIIQPKIEPIEVIKEEPVVEIPKQHSIVEPVLPQQTTVIQQEEVEEHL